MKIRLRGRNQLSNNTREVSKKAKKDEARRSLEKEGNLIYHVQEHQVT